MNISVGWKAKSSSAVDITNYVISYEREGKICNGTATLSMVMADSLPYTFATWDRITVSEEGRRKGMYWISEISKNTKGERQILCQDGSLRLVDYFITDAYFIDYASYTKYWISKFMTDAGVSYQFDVEGDGTLVSDNTSLGPGSAYELIVSLLQQSGWYMFFDSDNICHIGDLHLNEGTVKGTITDSTILAFKGESNDKMSRNRAVVWGNGKRDGSWVYADLQRNANWQTNAKDIRTVVLSNGSIRSSSAAESLAAKVLDEFCRTSYEKTLEIAGEVDVELGNNVKVKSKYYRGTGMATTVGSRMSKSGLVTVIVLDERCPRLFGYFAYEGYVYIGTAGAGVWRKHLGEDDWTSFSYGLNEYDVKDLLIRGGVYACVSGTHGYINDNATSAEWEMYEPDSFVDENGITWPYLSLEAVACDIDSVTHHVFFAYKLIESVANTFHYQKSWVDEVGSDGKRVNRFQILIDTDKTNFRAVDFDKHGKDLVPVAEAPVSYAPPDVLWGYRKCYPTALATGAATAYGVSPGTYGDALKLVANVSTVHSSLTIQGSAMLGTGFSMLYYYTVDEDDNIFHASRNIPGLPYSYGGIYGLVSRTAFMDGQYDSTGAEIETPYYHIVDIVNTSFPGVSPQILLYDSIITPLINSKPISHSACTVVATSNITLSGGQTIDGISVTSGTRVLVTGQSDPKQNGIYYANSFGAWSRGEALYQGSFFNVVYGDTYAGTAWQIVTYPEDVETIYIGLTELSFVQVLNMVSQGSMVVSDLYSDYSNISGSQYYIPYPNVYMRDGILYVFWSGVEKESEQGRSYYAIYADGVLTKELYQTWSATWPNIPNNEPQYGNVGFVSLLEGMGLIQIQTINSIAPGSQIHTATSSVLVHYFSPTGYESWGKILRMDDDATMGDWFAKKYPVHGVSVSTAAVINGKAIEGNLIRPLIKFTARGSAHSMWHERFPPVSFDRLFTLTYGVYDAIENDFIWSTSASSDESAPEEPDWDYNLFRKAIATRGLPIFVYNTKEIWDSTYCIKLGQLDHYNSISDNTDDFDGGIYTSENSIIYKESGGGGTIASMAGEGMGNGFIITNGMFVSHGPGNPGGFKIVKIRTQYILQGVNFCYVLKGSSQSSLTIVDHDVYSLKAEEDKEFPLMTFTTPGYITSYAADPYQPAHRQREHAKVYKPNYQTITLAGEFNDVRSFDLLNQSLVTTNGTVNFSKGKYVLTAGRDSTLRIISTASPYRRKILADGLSETNTHYGKVETSNYSYPPHFFTSMSGTGTPQFFERLAGANVFTEYSELLPAPDITCIRLDDRI